MHREGEVRRKRGAYGVALNWSPHDSPAWSSAATNDRYLALMSDGITDQMESYEVIEFVHDCAVRGLGPEQVGRSKCFVLTLD